MRIHAKPGIGEFGHVGPSDDDEAGGAKTRQHGCVTVRGLRVGKNPGAGCRYLAGNIEQILY